jgi:ATP-dependent phosphofructokinase / diphosphate-dependent phosphofructokinase
MGRDAGWICLNAAIAGGAHVALIPEIPYEIDKVAAKINDQIENGRGFAIVVVAEGAKPVGGGITARDSDQPGYLNKILGGVGHRVLEELKGKVSVDARVTILGHLQRGGSPTAYDRVLATQFGVKSVELVLEGQFGHMVAYRHPNVVSVPIETAISEYNNVKVDSALVHTARGVGISLGD